MKRDFTYEEEIIKFWEKNNIEKKVDKSLEKFEKFVVIDGPPYPTGEIHIGHLRNWATKDVVLRFNRMCKRNVIVKDGYDVNGLPVESKVQKELGLNDTTELRKYGEENFVKKCKEYVAKIIDDMSERRVRYGLSMSRNYYHTAHPKYLSLAWKFFEIANKKKLLYKGVKCVAWSPKAETTLSDYEIKDEYTILEDPSVYVKFELEKKFWQTGICESFLIWTTTPWTLQSNMAIAMNSNLNYARVLFKREEVEEILIMCEDLIENVCKKLEKKNFKFVSVLDVKKGIQFEKIKYKHILLNETFEQQDFAKLENPFIHAIIMADFVEVSGSQTHLEKIEKKGTYKHTNAEGKKELEKKEEKENLCGTGIVHIAPGHGIDDCEVCEKLDIPIFSPISSTGLIETGKFMGLYFKDADNKVIDYLEEKRSLLISEKKKHRYPLCWRTKVPIVYRAVEQWCIKRSQYTKDIVKANENVLWHPKFAKENFNHLIEKAGDWYISRQRFWGIPLPIFEDEDGNFEVFGSKEQLEVRAGVKLDDIHLDDLRKIEIVNEKSGKKMKAVPYITDVWFDSGCASFASYYDECEDFDEIIKKYYPINFITESEDQIRGWFSSLFNVGYLLTGKAPYKKVLYHGFVMAKDGTKMSKSKGNGITGKEALEKFGADSLRHYFLIKTFAYSKINFDEDELKEVFGFFNTLENIVNFLKPCVEKFKGKENNMLNFTNLEIEDKWILCRFEKTTKTFFRKNECFDFNLAFLELEKFIVEDFSKVYLKLIKERIENFEENLLVLTSNILRRCLVMLSPVIPFKAEQLYQKINFQNKLESIFLESFVCADEFFIKQVEEKNILENFEVMQSIMSAILHTREKAKIGIRWALGSVNIIGKIEPKNLESFEKLIKDLTNILKIEYNKIDNKINYIIKPNFENIKNDFKDLSVVINLINKNKYYIVEDLRAGKTYVKYEKIEINLEKHIIKELVLEEKNLISGEFNLGFVILDTNQDDFLLECGFLRELIRRVQDLRKKEGYTKEQKVNLSFKGSDVYFLELVKNSENHIKNKTNVEEILECDFEKKMEVEIKGKKLVVGVE